MSTTYYSKNNVVLKQKRLDRYYKNKQYNKDYILKNRDKYLQWKRDYNYRHKDQCRQWTHNNYLANKGRYKQRARKWQKQHPRSNSHYSIELQTAMNNIRKRDHNTCQWQNCGLTHHEAPIHIHHIFPKKEYPDLLLVEQYMICYCANHHGMWHRYRGDNNPLVHTTKRMFIGS